MSDTLGEQQQEDPLAADLDLLDQVMSAHAHMDAELAKLGEPRSGYDWQVYDELHADLLASLGDAVEAAMPALGRIIATLRIEGAGE